MDKVIIQLFVWDRRANGERVLSDIVEADPPELLRQLKWRTDGRVPEPGTFELIVQVRAGDRRFDLPPIPVTVGTPAGKRVPRPCVEVEGTIRDFKEWVTTTASV